MHIAAYDSSRGYVPSRIHHEEGFVSTTDRGWEYCYYKKDHVGNVRMLLRGSGTGFEERQRMSYYPFGTAHPGSYRNLHLNRRLFSGKELEDAALGPQGMVGWYDYGARLYNPRLGRWLGPDPLARKYKQISAYAYCLNSPVNYIDRWGLQAEEPPVAATVDIEGVEVIGVRGKEVDRSALNSFRYQYIIYIYRSGYNPPSAIVRHVAGRSVGPDVKRNPIVEAVYAGHRNFLLGALGVGGRVIEIIGDGLTYGGALVSSTGFGAAAGAPSMGLGTLLSTTGSFMQIGYEYQVTKEVNWIGLGNIIVGYGFGQLGSIRGLSDAESVIAQYLFGIPFSSLSMAEYIFNGNN